MRTLIFDIETNALLDKLYVCHCMVVQDADTREIFRFNNSEGTPVLDGLTLLDQADVIVGHNIINFDIPALKKLFGWEPKAIVRDTLVLSRLLYTDLRERDIKNCVQSGSARDFPNAMVGRHGLKAWGYRLNILKGGFLESGDLTRWTLELEDYCEQDVKVTLELYKLMEVRKYSEKAITLEHDFAWGMAMQEQHGFKFDVENANKLYADLATERIGIEQELQKVFEPRVIEMKLHWWEAGGVEFSTKSSAIAAGHKPRQIIKGRIKTKTIPFNPASRDHIAERLKEKGWKPSAFTPNGKPKVDETVLLGLPYKEAKLLARYFLLQKRMGQLADGDAGWIKLEKGGRIHGHVITNGAVTGRCTHRHPNMAQVPREPKFRALFTASEGKVLVGCDASGLELRCLAHYMNDPDYTQNLLESDIHTVNQKAAGLPTRDTAKTVIYGFLYGAGDAKVGQLIGGTAKDGAEIRQRFLSSLPSLSFLKQKISATLEKRDFLVGLDRRELAVRSEHSALNTLLQSAGALVMKKAAVILFKKLCDRGAIFGKDFAFVANVHDEIQLECWPESAEMVGQDAVDSIREAGEFFNFRCPLDGEAKIGSTWAETH